VRARAAATWGIALALTPALAGALGGLGCFSPAPERRGPLDAGLRRAERECDAGDAGGCERAGRLYLKGAGTGVPQDLNRASELLERACAADRREACVALGTARAMRGDRAGGAELYRRACEAGSAEGCYALAEVTRARDPDGAAELFGRACDEGFTAGCYSLGASLARGDFQKRDLPRAARLFDRACSAGDGRACFALAFQLERGSGVNADPQRASVLFGQSRKFFQELCSVGEAYACHNLALIFAGGLGTPARPERAREYLERACQLGNQPSCSAAPEALRREDPL
jgi:TPR repeat protein